MSATDTVVRFAGTILRNGIVTQVACGLIAVLLWTMDAKQSFGMTVGYSFLIGNCIWILIDSARVLLGRWRARLHGTPPAWPGWTWMVPVALVGTMLGYALGATLADWVFTRRSPSPAASAPALLVSVIAAAIIVYLFYARGRLAAEQLATEAAQREAAQVQLRLLQSQLEPHMLFNTLANLRVLIGLDPARAQEMLDHLIAFLRTTLAASRQERHALAAEFDCVRDYLALMSVRMGPRLQVRLELPADLRELVVPPMLLQPLVENAIKHGVEPRVEGGLVEVRAERVGETLCLLVHDTGVGPGDAAHVAVGIAAGGAAPSGPAGAAAGGFGLAQVRSRLATLYGERASLRVQPAPGGGTDALLRLPAP